MHTNALGDPWYQIVWPSEVRVNSQIHPVDGTSHLSRDLTHELGHVLGFDEYFGCSQGETIMDRTEVCSTLVPAALDLTNHHSAYHADAVSTLNVTSPASNTVSLSWNPTAIHNEADFTVWRWDGTGWIWVGSTSKNSQQTPWYGGQPTGTWYYANFPRTYADNQGHLYGDAVWQLVTIQGGSSLPAVPTNVTCFIFVEPTCQFQDNSTNETSFKVTWWRWTGSSWVVVGDDIKPALGGSGGYFTSQTPGTPSTGFYYGAWAYACNSAGCAGPSNFLYVFY